MKIPLLFSKYTFVCEHFLFTHPLGYTWSLTATEGKSCFSKSPSIARSLLFIRLSPRCLGYELFWTTPQEMFSPGVCRH